MANSVHSIHALVRLFKSSTDPPSTPGPSKIEIACLAWSDASFRAANKGEVIGEWILSLLGQAKKIKREKDSSSNPGPFADPRYWTLLRDVLTIPPTAATRPAKTWLLPMLNRFQLDTIVIELLTLRLSEVLVPSRPVLAVLWPLVEKKMGVDALGECLSAVLDACEEWERVDENLGWICSTVVGAFRHALSNAGNKKKLYNTFITAHLSSWLRIIRTNHSLVGPSSTKQLQDNIYAAGADTLFSLDALKQPLHMLFDALSSSTSLVPSLLSVLPKLFASFLSATHRDRSALFVSATSALSGKEEVRKKGMEFVGRCWTLVRDSASLQEDFGPEMWKSVIGVFEIVEKERLFVVYRSHADLADGKSEEELALSEARDKAVEILEFADPSSYDQVVPSIQLLDVLVKIEYDFVGSVVERVLSALINIPPSLSLVITLSSDLLAHVLEFHIKTRTVHKYALALLGAVFASSAPSTSRTPSSPFMTRSFPLSYHLAALARALRASLTPSQTIPLATATLQAVENAWSVFRNADQEEERPSKKRKVTDDANNGGRGTRSMTAQIRTFWCICCVAGTILSNLPANAYTSEGEYSLESFWGHVGKLGWIVVSSCLKIEKDGEIDTVKGKDGKKRKHMIETGPHPTLNSQIVTAATLRFLYDVRARVFVPLGDCDRIGRTSVAALLNVARDEASDPELVLESIRTLLWHLWYTHDRESEKRMEAQPIFTVVFDILSSFPLSESKWSGASAGLTRDNLGIAVLYVLTDRWIDVLDMMASTKTLESVGENSDDFHLQRDDVVITLHAILLNLFRNAQFWELHNIRAGFLSFVLALTAPLSSYSSPTSGVGSLPLTSEAQTDLALASDVYRLLLYVPSEYFTRSARAELVKRAVAADVQICRVLECGNGRKTESKRKGIDRSHARSGRISHMEESDGRLSLEELKNWSRHLTSVRVFSQRMGHLNAPSHATSLAFASHLLNPPACISSPPEALTSVTLNLIHFHVVVLMRSQEPEAAASVSGIISTLVAIRPFSQPCSRETWTHVIVQSSVLRLVECLSSEFDSASLPGRIKDALDTLVETLESALSPHARRLPEIGGTEPEQFFSSERIDAWSRMLALARWLGLNSQAASAALGLKLARSMTRSEDSAGLDFEACSSILGVLFEELWCMPDDSHRAHLDVLVGFYAVIGGDQGSHIKHTIDARVAQASKKLSVQDFSYLLDVLVEAIGKGGLRVCQRERLIRLSKIILHDAPQGTLKVIQGFATRCFDLFVNRHEIYGSSSRLKMQSLEFIARHCSDRPAAIRSVDLSSIWSLLHKTLSGSSEHDATTMLPVFHHIVTIVGALIRLRRDLVVHTLPHLSLVLCQLMSLTRKIRPQLGAKQGRMVTDTFPSWLSASQPFSTGETRALARLLTSLATKTIPRTHHAHATTAESQKATSLAKPFAKHASYVLVAYVNAFNDPLCILDADTRRELEPGLFALCEIVGEHSRDALMLSALDSGGKTIMKSLWREYEKQRYVGKG